MDEHECWQRWDTFGSRLTWQTVLAKATNERTRRVARQALAEVPPVTAVEDGPLPVWVELLAETVSIISASKRVVAL